MENFARVGSSRVSGTAFRNLSPTWEYNLGTVVRAVQRVKFGIRNVRRTHLTDIFSLVPSDAPCR